jgi:hypothetical protein
MDLRETECDNLNWIHVACLKRPETGSCERNKPSGSIKCAKFILSFQQEQCSMEFVYATVF